MKTKNMVWEIIKKELRDIVRDKKTLAMMIIMPIVLYPLMLGFFFVLSDKQNEEAATEYIKVGFTFEPEEALDTVLKECNVEEVDGDKDALHEDLINGEIDAYVTLEDDVFKIFYSEEDMNGYMSAGILNEAINVYIELVQSQMLTNEGLVAEEIFDVYTNAVLGNKKSIAYSLTFGSNSKTLTDDEINPVLEKIISSLEKTLNAELRK